LVEKSLRGITSIDLRVEMMAQLKAVTGFNELETPFVVDHFAFAR